VYNIEKFNLDSSAHSIINPLLLANSAAKGTSRVAFIRNGLRKRNVRIRRDRSDRVHEFRYENSFDLKVPVLRFYKCFSLEFFQLSILRLTGSFRFGFGPRLISARARTSHFARTAYG